MTHTQHTPGPWAIFETLRHREEGTVGIYGNESVLVADVQIWRGVMPQAESEANARLIAAAPDLLAACIAAIAWADKVPAPYREWPHVAAARAAIAQATGNL